MTGKKMVALLLAAVLSVGALAGCGGDGAGASSTETGGGSGGSSGTADGSSGAAANTAKGRYVETEIELPEGANRIYAAGKLSDGSVLVAAAGGGGDGFIFQSQDMGETWEMSGRIPGVTDSWIQGAAVSPDGTIAMAGFFMEIDDMEEEQLVLTQPDGSQTSVPIVLPPTTSDIVSRNLVEQIAYDGSGNLFVQDLNFDILKVDTATGNCTKAYDLAGRPEYFGIAGEMMLVVKEDGITRFRTTDGSSLPDAEALNDIVKNDYSIVQRAAENSFPMVMGKGMDEGSVVYVNHNGVFYYKDGGSVSEQLVSAELSSLGVTESYFSIIMFDEENLLVHMSDGTGESRLCRYSYDKDIPAVPEKELNIYALEESQALKQAVVLYQKQHQDVYVRLQIGMTGADGISAEDAISTLNTEILAGNMPDILILDGLPVESYIEKGILADISGVIGQMDQSDGLFSGVRDAYVKDGSCYQFPARFFLTMAAGSQEAVDASSSLKEFADYAAGLREEHPGKAVLKPNAPKEFLWQLYQIDSASWFGGDGSLQEDALEDFLTQAKRLYDIDGYGDDDGGIHKYNGMPVGSSVTELMTGQAMISYGIIVDTMDFVAQYAVSEKSGTTFGLFGDDAVFVPYLLTGISSTTDAKEEAEAFFLTLAGAECGSLDGYGFPVNRAAWKVMREHAAEDYGPDSGISIGFSTPDGTSDGYMMNTLTEEHLAEVDALLEKVCVPADTDAVIQELVLTEGLRYLKGESSYEDTLAALKQKISLYLAE